MTTSHGQFQNNLGIFERDGIVRLPGSLPRKYVDKLRHALRNEAEMAGGVRHVQKRCQEIRSILKREVIQPLLDCLFGSEFACVRSIYFHKTLETNWSVPWHQDVTIAVARKVAHPDFNNWTLKNNVPHVEAPLDLLRKMVTIRVHLDDVNAGNGPLEVLCGSHKKGRIKGEVIGALSEEMEISRCTGASGSVFLMRPLALHRSGRIQNGASRRTLQLECAPIDALPEPLAWYEL